MTSPIPPFRCSVVRDYVFVEYQSTFPGADLRAHAAVFEAVDAELIASRVRLVLFDTRAMSSERTEETRSFCWQWAMARAHHDRAAIVASSDLLRVQSNMTSRAKNMPLRSFATTTDAVAWLRGP